MCVCVCVLINVKQLHSSSCTAGNMQQRIWGFEGCWIKEWKHGLLIFDVWSKEETIAIQRAAAYWRNSLYTPGCLLMSQIWDLGVYFCVCTYAWLCFWGTIHPFPLYGGPLSGRSIVDVPCPLPGDIHHRGAPDHPQPLLSKPRGSALMRARSPHPSKPYGDYLLYSTRNREITPEPQLHKATKIKYCFNYFVL